MIGHPRTGGALLAGFLLLLTGCGDPPPPPEATRFAAVLKGHYERGMKPCDDFARLLGEVVVSGDRDRLPALAQSATRALVALQQARDDVDQMDTPPLEPYYNVRMAGLLCLEENMLKIGPLFEQARLIVQDSRLDAAERSRAFQKLLFESGTGKSSEYERAFREAERELLASPRSPIPCFYASGSLIALLAFVVGTVRRARAGEGVPAAHWLALGVPLRLAFWPIFLFRYIWRLDDEGDS